MSNFNISYVIKAVDQFSPAIKRAQKNVDKMTAKAAAATAKNTQATKRYLDSLKKVSIATEKLARIDSHLAKIKQQTARIGKASDEASISRLDTLRSRTERLAREQAKLRRVGGQVAGGLPKAVAHSRASELVMLGKLDAAQQKLNKSRSFKERMGGINKRASSAMLTGKARLFALGAAAAAALYPVKAASDYELAVDKARRAAGIPKIPKSALESVNKIASEFGENATELIAQFEELLKAGLPMQTALSTLREVVVNSMLTDTPLTASTSELANIIKLMDVKAKDIPELSSVILYLADKTTKDATNVTKTLNQAANILSTAGIKPIKGAILSAVLTEKLGSSGKAATGIQSILTFGAKRAPEFYKAFVEDQVKAVRELKKKLSRFDTAAQITILSRLFRLRGAKAMQALLVNVDEFAKFTAAVEDTSDAMKSRSDAVDKRLATLHKALDQASSKTNQMFTAGGTTMIPEVKATVDAFGSLMKKLTATINAHPMAAKLMGLGVAGAFATGATATGVAVLGSIAAFIATSNAAIAALVAAPVLATAGAVAAGSVALVDAAEAHKPGQGGSWWERILSTVEDGVMGMLNMRLTGPSDLQYAKPSVTPADLAYQNRVEHFITVHIEMNDPDYRVKSVKPTSRNTASRGPTNNTAGQ